MKSPPNDSVNYKRQVSDASDANRIGTVNNRRTEVSGDIEEAKVEEAGDPED